MPWERPVKNWPWESLLPRAWPILSLAKFRQALTNFNEAADHGVTIARFADLPAVQQNQIATTVGSHPPIHKIDQLLQTASSNQFVIVVPANVTVELRFVNTLSSFFPGIIVLVGEGATVTFIETRRPSQKFGGTSVSFLCDKGSRLHQLMEDASGGASQSAYTAYADTHSHVSLAFTARFTSYQHLTAAIHHTGWNTRGTIHALCDTQGSSQSYAWLMNNHTQQRGRGEIHCAALGRDAASLQIDGWIRIGLKGRATLSTLHEDALLLSPDSRVKTIPNLEILNNDVKAYHAATVGRLSAAQLYYLMSRGLSESQARRLLVHGFAGRVAQSVERPDIKNVFEHFLA